MDEDELRQEKYLFRGSQGCDESESNDITTKRRKGLSDAQMRKPAPCQRYTSMIGN